MQLSEIAYPIYRLRDYPPQQIDGVTFYLTERAKDTFDDIEYTTKLAIVDDKNIDKPTLGERRLIIRNKGETPFRLNRAIFFLGDLIKISTPNTWFIDSKGVLFQHKKETRARLIYRKVTKLIPLPAGGVIVEVQGMQLRMKALFTPSIPMQDLYAGVLVMGMSVILYGFYDQQYKDTWRRV